MLELLPLAVLKLIYNQYAVTATPGERSARRDKPVVQDNLKLLTGSGCRACKGAPMSSGIILTYTLYWYISSYTLEIASYTMLVYNSG